MSTVYNLLLRQFTCVHEFQLTRSIRMTFAPKSLKIIPQNGAGARPAISITLRPLRAILNCLDDIVQDDGLLTSFRTSATTLSCQLEDLPVQVASRKLRSCNLHFRGEVSSAHPRHFRFVTTTTTTTKILVAQQDEMTGHVQLDSSSIAINCQKAPKHAQQVQEGLSRSTSKNHYAGKIRGRLYHGSLTTLDMNSASKEASL